MKRPIALALALICVLGLLAACGEAPAETPANTTPKFEIKSEELWLESGGKKVYGKIFVPQGDKDKYPVVILSHGFNSNCMLTENYAEKFAKADYVAYIYDFCGGSPSTRSEGDVKEMSVLTERQNLEDVMDQIKALPYVDGNNLFLSGLSQGGLVSALAAAHRPGDVKGLMLVYPALSIPDNVRNAYATLDDVPEEGAPMMGVELGKIYYEDAFDIDAYAEIAKFEKDVIICHGDSDSSVPISFSEKAVQAYKSCELKVIAHGEHGFQPKQVQQTVDYFLEYMAAHIS